MKNWVTGYLGFIIGVIAFGGVAYWYYVKVITKETGDDADTG